MLSKRQYWILTAVTALALATVVVNMGLFRGNLATQAEIAGRAQFVQQSAQLEVLHREMVRALAELSARNNDADLRELLAAQGITFSVNPAPAQAGRTAPAAPAAPARR